MQGEQLLTPWATWKDFHGNQRVLVVRQDRHVERYHCRLSGHGLRTRIFVETCLAGIRQQVMHAPWVIDRRWRCVQAREVFPRLIYRIEDSQLSLLGCRPDVKVPLINVSLRPFHG